MRGRQLELIIFSMSMYFDTEEKEEGGEIHRVISVYNISIVGGHLNYAG